LVADIGHTKGYVDSLSQLDIPKVNLFTVYLKVRGTVYLNSCQRLRILVSQENKEGYYDQGDTAKRQEQPGALSALAFLSQMSFGRIIIVTHVFLQDNISMERLYLDEAMKHISIIAY
jgi:hypothetical protein